MKEILDWIWIELAHSVTERKHPFGTFVLANVQEDNKVRQRTVVLRKVEPMSTLTFYTDSRSRKIKELNAHDQVSILFYDNQRKVQLSCQGSVKINSTLPLRLKTWDPRTLKDYTTVLPPGTPVDGVDGIHHNTEEINFATVEVALKSIEYLELSREGHTRIQFDKQEDNWVGQYLVP